MGRVLQANASTLVNYQSSSSCAVSKDIGDQCSTVAFVKDFSQREAGPVFDLVRGFAPLLPGRSSPETLPDNATLSS